MNLETFIQLANAFHRLGPRGRRVLQALLQEDASALSGYDAGTVEETASFLKDLAATAETFGIWELAKEATEQAENLALLSEKRAGEFDDDFDEDDSFSLADYADQLAAERFNQKSLFVVHETGRARRRTVPVRERVPAPPGGDDPTKLDRYRGALVGLAACDALGTTLEFQAPEKRPWIGTIVGGGVFDLQPGEWTDDTSMALCLAESLIERGDFDPIDQMNRYVRWWREGYYSPTGYCFDIGNTTRQALMKFLRDGEAYAGSTDPNTSGNGSLMRLAPIPLFFANHPSAAIELAGASSKTTHATLECVDSCRYFAALIIGALRGESKETLLAPFYEPVPGLWETYPLAPRVSEIAGGSFKRPGRIGSGYVIDTLEAALRAFYEHDNFRDGALAAVNDNGDPDTVGAVYGQIAGAYYGLSGIPEEWRQVVAYADEIIGLATDLARLSERIAI